MPKSLDGSRFLTEALLSMSSYIIRARPTLIHVFVGDFLNWSSSFCIRPEKSSYLPEAWAAASASTQWFVSEQLAIGPTLDFDARSRPAAQTQPCWPCSVHGCSGQILFGSHNRPDLSYMRKIMKCLMRSMFQRYLGKSWMNACLICVASWPTGLFLSPRPLFFLF